MTKQAPYAPPTGGKPPTGPVWQRALGERLWVTYTVPDEPERTKPRKLPHGLGASMVGWNQRLMTYPEAQAQMKRARHAGIGYLPQAGSALVVVDFDDVLLSEDLTRQAHAWIDTAGYWELSTSGNGYHCILPRPAEDSDWTLDGAKNWLGYLGSSNKFVAFTFRHVAGDAVEDVPNLIDAIRIERKRVANPERKATKPLPIEEQWWLRLDPRLLRDAIEEGLTHIKLPEMSDGARRELWIALALSLKVTGNPWAEAEFLLWSRKQPGYLDDADVMDNWERCHPDGSVTFQTFLYHATQGGFDHKPYKAKAEPYDDKQAVVDLMAMLGMLEAEDGDPPPKPEALPDLWAVAEAYPEPTFVLPQYLPRGICTSLFGKDGSGKSMLALELCLHLAAGKTFAGLSSTAGRVEFYSVEDPLAVIAQRIRSIGRAFDFSPTERQAAAANMPDLMRRDYLKMADTRLLIFDRDGDYRLSEFMRAIMEHTKRTRPQLVVFDPISDVFGDEENVRQKVAAFMRVLNTFAAAEELSIMLLGHPAKAEGSEYSGSGAWSSKVRSRLFLEPEAEDNPDLMVMRQRKASWGPMAADLMFQRTSTGVLMPIAGEAAQVEAAAAQAARDLPIRTLIYDTIRMAVAAGTPLVISTNQPNNVGKMVNSMNKMRGDWRAITNLALAMMAEGVLREVLMDGSDGLPRVVNGARMPRKGLWPS